MQTIKCNKKQCKMSIIYKDKIIKTIFDKRYLKQVKNHKWQVYYKKNKNVNYYYICNTKNRLYLHQLIIGKAPKGFVCDHKNQNTLDNRKCNLRHVTVGQNQLNKIGRNNAGIFKCKIGWRAKIMFNYKTIWLGKFKTFKEAKRVRLLAEKRYFGV